MNTPQNTMLYAMLAMCLIQLALFAAARASEHQARSTYWSTPTVAQVQARYRLCRWTLLVFAVISIIGILLVF